MGEQVFYFSGGSYLRQLQGLHQALGKEPSVQFLIGREGTGKSALCEKLARFLVRKQQRVLHFASGVESPELLRLALARQLDLPAQGNPATLIEEASHAGTQPIVLIVDDAHLLTEVTLLEINRLAQVQTGGRRVCSVVLGAEPNLLNRIHGKSELAELQKPAEQSFELQPMSVAELEVFLQAFAVEAGVNGLGFTEDAMHLLYKLCKGYPGPASKLAVEIVGNLSGAPRRAPLNRGDLDQLIKNSDSEQLLPSFQLSAQSARPGLLPVAAVVVIASLAFVYQQLNQQSGAQSTAGALPASPEFSPFTDSAPVALQIDTNDGTVQAEASAAAGSAPVVAARTVQSGQRETSAAQNQPESLISSTELDADRAQLLAAMEQVRQAAQATTQAASDSDLVLVTAAERGISADQFALPRYEDLLRLPESGSGLGQVARESTESSQGEARDERESALPTAAVTADAADNAAQPAAEAGADSSTADAAMAGLESTVAVTDSPESEAEVQEQSAARRIVDDWVLAWQSRNLEAYFALYHSRFQPRYQDSVAQWRRNRQRVIGNAAWIALELTDFQVVEADPENIEVQFWLGYESGSYQDRTLKKLVLAREDNAWRIIEEVNLEVQA